MTTINPPARTVDPTTEEGKFVWFDPSRLTRGQLMKAAKLRELPTDVSQSNVQLIEGLYTWMDANGVRQPDPDIEIEDDEDEDEDGPDLDEELSTTPGVHNVSPAPKVPATGATSASAPVAGQPEDAITVSRADWDRMQATLDRLLNAQSGAVAKPLDLTDLNATRVASGPTTAGGRPAKTGVFPGGYRAEHFVGPRDPDDNMHFALIEATHDAAREAGYRPKGAPLAGLRIGYSSNEHGRTVIYEVAIHRDME